MTSIVSSFRATTCRCLASLCYDSAPSGESRVPEKTPWAKGTRNPLDITVSGQNSP